MGGCSGFGTVPAWAFILSFFFFPNYLFWAVLGFHSFAQDFFSCAVSRVTPCYAAVSGFHCGDFSLLAECGLSTLGLSRCGAPARSLRMSDLPGPGSNPSCLRWQVGILPTAPTREVLHCALLFLQSNAAAEPTGSIGLWPGGWDPDKEDGQL